MDVRSIDAWVEGPAGFPTLKVTTAKITNTINAGVKWDAEVPFNLGTKNWAPTDEFRLHMANGVSMPLVCTEPDWDTYGGLGTTRLSGQDKTSFLLTASGLSMPSMHNMMAKDVIRALCSRATNNVVQITSPQPPAYVDSASFQAAFAEYLIGVTTVDGSPPFTIQYMEGTPLDTMRIEQFDVQGGSMGEYLTHILRDTGCNYRIGPNGELQIFRMDYRAENANITPGRTRWKKRLSGIYTQVWCRKQSRAKGFFSFTATKTGITDGSLAPFGLQSGSMRVGIVNGGIGNVAYIAGFTGAGGKGSCCFYEAVDPAYAIGGAKYAATLALVGPIVSGVCMSIAFSVEPVATASPTTTVGATSTGTTGATSTTSNIHVVVWVSGTPGNQTVDGMVSGFSYDPTFVVTDPPDILVTDPTTGIVYVAGTTTNPVTGNVTYTGEGEGDHAARQLHLIVDSSLWPTQSWLLDNGIPQLLLWEANKGTSTVTREVEYNPTLVPGGVKVADADAPECRYESVTLSTDPVNASVTGFEVPW